MTRGVRSPAAAALRDVVVDGRRLGPDRVAIDDEGTIRLRLARSSGGRVTVVVSARPLREPGGRRLGLPLFEVDVRPAGEPTTAVSP